MILNPPINAELTADCIHLNPQNMLRLFDCSPVWQDCIVEYQEFSYTLSDIQNAETGLLEAGDKSVRITSKFKNELLTQILDTFNSYREIPFDSLPHTNAASNLYNYHSIIEHAIRHKNVPKKWTSHCTKNLLYRLKPDYYTLRFLCQNNPQLHLRLIQESEVQDSEQKIIQTLLMEHSTASCELYLNSIQPLKAAERQKIKDFLNINHLQEETLWFLNYEHDHYDLEKERKAQERKLLRKLTPKPANASELKKQFLAGNSNSLHFDKLCRSDTLFHNRMPADCTSLHEIFPNLNINCKGTIEIISSDPHDYRYNSRHILKKPTETPRSGYYDVHGLKSETPHVIIPSKIGKTPVLAIRDMGYRYFHGENCRKAESLFIEEGIQYIGSRAFNEFKVENLVIPSSVIFMEATAMPSTLSSLVILSENCSFSSCFYLNKRYGIRPYFQSVQYDRQYTIYVPEHSNTLENLKNMIKYMNTISESTFTLNDFKDSANGYIFTSTVHRGMNNFVNVTRIIPLNPEELQKKANELQSCS